jgi:hypothetical protein
MKNEMTYTLRNPYGTGDMINNVPEAMLTRMVNYLAWMCGVHASSIVVVPDWEMPDLAKKTLTSASA